MNTENNLQKFQAIIDFVEALNELYSEKQRSLRLYTHLIGKTQVKHKKAIAKHVDLFRTFCINNRDGILEKNFDKFIDYKVIYSEKVYVDFEKIFEIIDKENVSVVQTHLLYLSALLDQTGNAKEILQKSKKTGENNFLSNIISKIENNVDPSANPMDAMGSILKSGIFTDMMSSMSEGLEKGDLDLGNLMGSVQSMVSDLNERTSSLESDGKKSKGMEEMSNMINNLSSTLSNIGSGDGEGETTDLNNMLGNMLGPLTEKLGGGSIPGGADGISNIMNLVSNMSGDELSIEERLNMEYEKSKEK